MRMQLRYTDRASTLAGALRLALPLFFAACLTGCASKNPLLEEPAASAKAQPAAQSGVVQTTRERRFLGIFSPYRPDIQQGNFISAEMMSQLKAGMTREQVRFLFGTPLLADPFHGDRWDYVFRMQKGNGEVISTRVAVFFKGNQLDHFDGSKLPTEREYLAIIAGTAAAPKQPAAAESK